MPRVKRTLPIASGGPEPKINFGDADWQRIERAYGHKLPSELRQKIFEVTASFVSFEGFERTAEPLSWATDRILRVRKGADQFHKAIFEDPHHQRDAYVYANHLIKRHFHEPRLPAKDWLHQLGGVLTSVVVACNHALREVSDPNLPGHREGDGWDQWIRSLTRTLSVHRLPTGARNDSDKTTGGRPSSFVALVKELQGCIPKDARRHCHSIEALAQAITRARRNKGRDTKTIPAS